MKYIFSVSKAYKHRGNHRHKSDTKKHWFIYYYDEEMNLHTEQVNLLQALYYKTKKFHRVRRYCSECDRVWEFLVKKTSDEVLCPYCDN